MIIDVYSDAGHGWAKVSMEVLKEYGIADKISGYSYMSKNGKFAFLEEDCDMHLFFQTVRATGKEVKVREHNARQRQSKIRNYPSYKVA
jgi:hypothetical protein